jgi:hypothetical protein
MEEGLSSELVYDEEHELFRFADGRFALSREHADRAGPQSHGLLRCLGPHREQPF